MKTVKEIVAAAQKLSTSQFVQLRRKLERLERNIWEAELEKTEKELRKRKITDEEIDRLVLGRRRENRR